MPGIFISYRRKDTGGHAGHLAADLISRYGRSNVFMDVDSIPAGVDYGNPIDDALDSCNIAFVLIGDNWVDPVGPEQKRRIDEESDWVRREVASALERPDVTVVPVLVEGAAMPEAADLPAEISSLANIQALSLHNSQWSYDFEELCGTVDHAASDGKLQRFLRQSRSWPKLGSAAVLGLRAVAAAVVLLSGGGTGGASCVNQLIPFPKPPPQKPPLLREPSTSAHAMVKAGQPHGFLITKTESSNEPVSPGRGWDPSRLLGAWFRVSCSLPGNRAAAEGSLLSACGNRHRDGQSI